MDDYSMNEAAWRSLVAQASRGFIGADEGFACNVSPTEHLHLRRIGVPGSGLSARVQIATHGSADDHEDPAGALMLYFAAPEARQIAARLLNLADEIDGQAPLLFFAEDEEDEEGTVALPADSMSPVLGAILIALAVGLPLAVAVLIARRFLG